MKVNYSVNFDVQSSKVADSKREEFRKYLEKAGVMDALTKGAVSLTYQVQRQTGSYPGLLNFDCFCVYSFG